MDKLKLIWDHKVTSVSGVLGGALVTLSLTPNLDTMSAKQILFAFGAGLALAIKGLFSADVQPPKP